MCIECAESAVLDVIDLIETIERGYSFEDIEGALIADENGNLCWEFSTMRDGDTFVFTVTDLSGDVNNGLSDA